MLQNDAINALFQSCPSASSNKHDPIGICFTSEHGFESIAKVLVGTAALKFMQTTVTFGALVPAGLFVPSLFIGGCIGRVLGGLLKFLGFFGAQELQVEPGIYAMVGAGAMLAGVSRLTITLAVVLFELTGGLTYIVPFMLSVLIAKWVGDKVTSDRSIYDVYSDFSGMAKVEPPEELRLLNATLQDLRTPGDSDVVPALWA